MPPLLSIFAGPVFFEFDFDWKPPKRKSKRERERDREGEGGLKIDFHLAAFRYFDALLACFTFGSCFRFSFRISVYANEIIDLFWYRFAFEDIERVPHKTWNRITFDPQGSRMPIYRNVNFLTSPSLNMNRHLNLNPYLKLALCVTAIAVRSSSFQFPFEYNQINYVCQWIEASAFRTLINGHFGLIEWPATNCSKKKQK